MIGFDKWDEIEWTQPQLDKFGRKLGLFRMTLEWTQKELGERVGLTASAISQYECGKHMPKRVMLAILYIFSQEAKRLAYISDNDENKNARMKADSKIVLLSAFVADFAEEVGERIMF